MNYLVGDKESFAIEFSFELERRSYHLMGNVRLWLKGVYIGAYEDTNILSVTLHKLEVLPKRDINGEIFVGKNEKAVYKLIHSENNTNGCKYFFAPGESFDDFSIVVYKYDEVLKFIWKLQDSPFFEYKNYPEGIQFADISIKEFERVIFAFKKQFDQSDKDIPVKP